MKKPIMVGKILSLRVNYKCPSFNQIFLNNISNLLIKWFKRYKR